MDAAEESAREKNGYGDALTQALTLVVAPVLFGLLGAFIDSLLARDIEPHIAVAPRGRQLAHTRIRMRVAASATNSRSGAGRRSKSCSGRPRTGTGCDAFGVEGFTAFAKRAT